MNPSTHQEEDKEFNPSTRNTKGPKTLKEWREIALEFAMLYHMELKGLKKERTRHWKQMREVKKMKVYLMIGIFVIGFVIGVLLI